MTDSWRIYCLISQSDCYESRLQLEFRSLIFKGMGRRDIGPIIGQVIDKNCKDRRGMVAMTTWRFEVPGKSVFFGGRILAWGMAYQLKAGIFSEGSEEVERSNRLNNQSVGVMAHRKIYLCIL